MIIYDFGGLLMFDCYAYNDNGDVNQAAAQRPVCSYKVI